MSGRRSHPRFSVATPWDGAMRVLRDVAVQRTAADELEAISQHPAVAGEAMTLDLMGAGEAIALKVRVVDSRPVMIDGAVRHRIRLTRLTEATQPSAAPARTPARILSIVTAEAL